MPKNKSVKKQKRAEFLDYLIDVLMWGKRLTEEEKEILRKRRLERNKSQLEKEQDLAK